MVKCKDSRSGLKRARSNKFVSRSGLGILSNYKGQTMTHRKRSTILGRSVTTLQG